MDFLHHTDTILGSLVATLLLFTLEKRKKKSTRIFPMNSVCNGKNFAPKRIYTVEATPTYESTNGKDNAIFHFLVTATDAVLSYLSPTVYL